MIVRLKDNIIAIDPDVTRYFNSMIVRLKEALLQEIEDLYIAFQFYDSPIKSVSNNDTSRVFWNFNSMIVRLKV